MKTSFSISQLGIILLLIFARLSKSNAQDKRFVIKNGMRTEAHAIDRRFDHRVILMTRLGLRRRLKFLGVAPSDNYSLFYNLGGNVIRYFNEAGEQYARHSAKGLQRGRILFNFNFKRSQPLRLSLSYLSNHEFNFLAKVAQKINVLNPNTGKVQRPFNNYPVIGMSLSYQLKGNKKNL